MSYQALYFDGIRHPNTPPPSKGGCLLGGFAPPNTPAERSDYFNAKS